MLDFCLHGPFFIAENPSLEVSHRPFVSLAQSMLIEQIFGSLCDFEVVAIDPICELLLELLVTLVLPYNSRNSSGKALADEFDELCFGYVAFVRMDYSVRI